MRTILVVSLAALAFGCARAPSPKAVAAHSVTSTMVAKIDTPARAPYATPAVAAAPELRAAGDFVVFRFSGSFRKEPLLLTQQVLRVDGPLVTVDMFLKPEKLTAKGIKEGTSHVRVVFDRTPGALREIARVTRFDGEREEAGTLEDYEKLMAETIVVPDSNDDVIGSEIVKAQIGDKTIDAKKTSYRVAFGKKSATMSTITSDTFAWGDVGGEIKTDEGKIIYRAEVVGTGRDQGVATAAR